MYGGTSGSTSRYNTYLMVFSKEECIAIEGIMEQRDEETYNPKIPSGTIELEATEDYKYLDRVYQTASI